MGVVIPWPLTFPARREPAVSDRPAFLVAEADLRSLATLRSFLRGVGLKARCLADGAAVIEALSRVYDGPTRDESSIDVVVIDVNMRGRSGIDVLALARERQWPIHVVPTSDSVSRLLRLQLLRMGATTVLTKPFTRAALKRMLKAVTSEPGE